MATRQACDFLETCLNHMSRFVILAQVTVAGGATVASAKTARINTPLIISNSTIQRLPSS